MKMNPKAYYKSPCRDFLLLLIGVMWLFIGYTRRALHKYLLILITFLYVSVSVLGSVQVAHAQSIIIERDLNDGSSTVILNRNPIIQGIRDFQLRLGLPTMSLQSLFYQLFNFGLQLLVILAVLILIYGGLLWMFSGGDDDKLSRAKRTIFNAIIGLIIIFSSYAIINFITDIFVGSQNQIL